MAGFGTRSGSPYSRGGSPGFRFTLYALASIVIMVLDQRMDVLERARYVLQTLTYPVEVAVNAPVAGWRWLQRSFASRATLEAENRSLRTRMRTLEVRTLRFDALARQNAALLGLKHAVPPVAARWLPADIVDIELGRLRQRVLIDRGTRNGVFRNQAVLDDYGVVGQTMHVGPWSADVLLITDPEHDLPVQIARTGFRTIAVGTGDPNALALPYLPANADVKVGDELVTSGLGGIFPAGYPVARITQIHRGAIQRMSQVIAQPFAHLQTDRAVMLLWFRPGSPAAPVPPNSRQLPTGTAGAHPLAPPPPPAPPLCTPPPTANSAPGAAKSAAPPGAPGAKPAAHPQHKPSASPTRTP
ncbi:MAG: rod shape-determining protein MreC [Steroidobacteraceae bacterium]